jgi:hypothetical protein
MKVGFSMNDKQAIIHWQRQIALGIFNALIVVFLLSRSAAV